GEYRVSLSGAQNADAPLRIYVYAYDEYGTGSGNSIAAGSGLYVTGFQIEEGSVATSYIKTEASQVTRTVGVSSVSVDDFPFNQDAFTFVVGWELKGAGP